MNTQPFNLHTILSNPELAGKLKFEISGIEIVNAIQTAARELHENKSEKISSEEKYLTPDQAAKMLQVSKVTLWTWNRKDILPAFKIGRQVRYKLSDIQKIAEGREASHEA